MRTANIGLGVTSEDHKLWSITDSYLLAVCPSSARMPLLHHAQGPSLAAERSGTFQGYVLSYLMIKAST